MSKLEEHDEGSKSKHSPDPRIVKTVKHILRPVQTPWMSINAISSYLTEDQLKQRVLYGIESDISYMQERFDMATLGIFGSFEVHWIIAGRRSG